MERPTSHTTEEEAELLFKGMLPRQWIINSHRKDYGKDFDVEIVDGKEVTGKNFFVQLKGTEKARISKDKKYVKFPLESKHARYYYEKLEQTPAFLVVIDINQKTGWWVFLQEYLGKNKKWKQQKSLTIEIPIDNSLEDIERLIRTVRHAVEFLRAKHPTSVNNSIRAVRETIETLDPRFSVKVNCIDGVNHIHLSPVDDAQSIEIHLNTKNELAREKFRDLIGFGKRVRFDPSEIEVSGSGIFEAFAQHPFDLQFAAKKRGSIELLLFDGTGGNLIESLDVAGVFGGGTELIRFESNFESSPIIRLVADMTVSGMETKIRFDFSCWNEKPVLNLPWFDKTTPFLEALTSAQSMGMRIYADGNTIGNSDQIDSNLEGKEQISIFAISLRKARKIFEHFKMNPTLRLSELESDFPTRVENTYALLFEGVSSSPASDFCRRLNAPTDYDPNQSDIQTSTPKKLSLHGPIRAIILGKELMLGTLHQEITDVVVTKIQHDSDANQPIFEIRGTESSVQTYYLEPIEEPAERITD